jgi:plastocyanin
MPDWSIRIVVENNQTKFDPKQLNASLDDLVSWNNTTEECHQPWMLDANGQPVIDPRTPIDPSKPLDPCDGGDPNDPPNFDRQSRLGVATYMSDCIAPGASSRPAFDTTPVGTISYYCRVHPQREYECGTIKVT